MPSDENIIARTITWRNNASQNFSPDEGKGLGVTTECLVRQHKGPDKKKLVPEYTKCSSNASILLRSNNCRKLYNKFRELW